MVIARTRKRSSSRQNNFEVFSDTDFEQFLADSKKANITTIDVEVVSETSSKLTPLELEEKEQLESQVEKSFYFAGLALEKLRDRRLYRDTHKNFGKYCLDRFGHTQQKSNYLIAGAKIYGELITARCTVMPAGEYQVRPLTALDSSVQPEAWNKAVSIAEGKVPTSRIVREVVEHFKEKPKHNPFELGEVVGIVSKDNPNLKGRNGAWAIITGVSKHHCNIKLWDTEIEEVAIEYLKEMRYTEDDCKQVKKLHRRIEKLRGIDKLEDTAKSFLSILGKIDRPNLTELEEQMLGVLEGVYGVGE